MTAAPDGLRDEVQAAALVALARDGAAFLRAPVVAAFAGRRASRASVYRWIAGALAGGGAKAGDAAADRIGALLADARRRADTLPDVIGRDSLALHLTAIIGAGVTLVHDARGPGGRFIKPRLALDALDLIRRSLVNAAAIAAFDAGAGDAMLREPIIQELSALLNTETKETGS